MRRRPRSTWTSCWRSASPPRRPPEAPAAAIVAAAGAGERLGAGGPKAFVELAGRPLLDWSLDPLRASDHVGTIVVAVPPGTEAEARRDGVEVVPGGETRSESVAAALAAV